MALEAESSHTFRATSIPNCRAGAFPGLPGAAAQAAGVRKAICRHISAQKQPSSAAIGICNAVGRL